MDGTITYPDGTIYWTTEKTDSDEFVFICLEKYLGRAIDGIRVVRNPGKKPYLLPRVAEFSITHTKGFLALALSSLPVGLDVEAIDRFDESKRNVDPNHPNGRKDAVGAMSDRSDEPPVYKRIARRFFGAEAESPVAFFKLWTAAEAAGKRDERFVFNNPDRNAGRVEYFTVSVFLLAVAF